MNPQPQIDRTPTPPALFHLAGGKPSALSMTVARNVRRLRGERGYSIEQLAVLSEVTLSALLHMEAAKGEPTLELAWRIANVLRVPFSALTAGHVPRGAVVMRKNKANVIVSQDLGLTTRSLLPFQENRPVEFYELRLAPHHAETSEPHAAGTVEILFVAEGVIEVCLGREPSHRIHKGDTICFPADLPHGYRNLTAMPATLYLVMTYRKLGESRHHP
jgi:transcriptional regulator with XRE-family HTH domain